MPKKKIWANLQRIIELFTRKIVTKLSKMWVWDPGSGKKSIPDPGSKGQKSTGSRIRNTAFRNPQKGTLHAKFKVKYRYLLDIIVDGFADLHLDGFELRDLSQACSHNTIPEVKIWCRNYGTYSHEKI
jgi:hypothetical protein